MQWIKSHLNIVICGAVSLISIVLIVLGIMLCDVQDVLGRDAGLVQRLRSVQPVNQRVIAYDQKIRDDNAREVETALAKLAEMGAHEPLHPDVFPEIKPGSQVAPFQFKELFEKARETFLETLNARDAPTAEEVAREKVYMETRSSRAQASEALGRGGETPERRPGTGMSSLSARPSRPGEKDLAAMTSEERAAEDAAVRLSIQRARSIYCYANMAAFGSWPAVAAVQRPAVDQMWYAQMGYWIQSDVVRALAELNNRTAEGLKSRNEEPWVGNLPVKQVKEFTVSGYLPLESGGSKKDVGPALTKRWGTSSVDVVRFRLDLVVDARMLPSVLDEICKAGFYTPLLVNYQTLTTDPSLVGYIYGSEPIIEVSIDFEGCFVRSKYEKWMPEAVKQAISEGRAVPERSGGRDRSTGGRMSPARGSRW